MPHNSHSPTNPPLPQPSPPLTSAQKGRFYEQAAAAWCHARGWVLLAANVRCRQGEIDLIALDGETLVFLEVRQRSTARFGTPAETITSRKQRRLLAAIRHWLITPAARPHRHRPMRCDLLAFTDETTPPLWIPNAITPSPD
ncbi:MAG: YraN family protein [Hydrogenophilus sp.]|nr:YraN family protein [Hydrogenophilus sp.]